jgi:hypothetical protein
VLVTVGETSCRGVAVACGADVSFPPQAARITAKRTGRMIWRGCLFKLDFLNKEFGKGDYSFLNCSREYTGPLSTLSLSGQKDIELLSLILARAGPAIQAFFSNVAHPGGFSFSHPFLNSGVSHPLIDGSLLCRQQ